MITNDFLLFIPLVTYCELLHSTTCIFLQAILYYLQIVTLDGTIIYICLIGMSLVSTITLFDAAAKTQSTPYRFSTQPRSGALHLFIL